MHAPIKRVRIKNIKNPWFNENIQNMIYERNHYHQKFLKTKENEYWLSYRLLRNKINIAIKNIKKEYYHNLITNNNNDLRGMWRALRHVLPPIL